MSFSDASGQSAPSTSFTPNKSIDTTFGAHNPNESKGKFENKNVYDITYGAFDSIKPYLSFTTSNALVLNNGAFVADMGISSQSREMNVGLNNTTGNYSLQGDFIARSGANATLNVEFSKSVKGNIKTINVIDDSYYQISEEGEELAFSQKTTTRTFTFKSGATLEGDITGGLLDSSNVTVYKRKYVFNDFVDKFIFEDSNVNLQNISYNGGSTSIVIKGKGSIKNISTAWGGYGMGPYWDDFMGTTGSIYVAFEKNDTGKNTINQINGGGGMIDVIFGASRDSIPTTATGSAQSEIMQGVTLADGSLNLIFATNGNATIGKLSDDQTGHFSGDDAFRFRGGGAEATANITFMGSGTNKIDGNIVSYGNFGSVKKTLNLLFKAGTSSIEGGVYARGYVINNITFGADTTGEKIIKGDVLGSSSAGGGKGTNNIVFKGHGEAKIEGGVSSHIGENTIEFNTSNNNATITGSVVANSDGKNTILFNGTGNNAISKGVATVGAGVNAITFKGTNNTIDGSMNNVGSDSGNIAILTWNNGSNIFNLADNSATLTINNDLYHRWNAKNTEFNISGNNSKLVIKNIMVDGDGGQGVNINFAGANGSLEIGSTQSSTFTAGTLINGSSGAGKTNITFSEQGSIKGNIDTRNSARTNITFGTGATNTITGIVKSAGGTNQITFNGTTNKIDGGLASTGGSNRLSFNGTTNTIEGVKLDGNGNSGHDYSFLTYNGGSNLLSLEKDSSQLTINGAIYHRYSGKRTEFNINGDNSVLTLGSANIDGGAGDGIVINSFGLNNTLSLSGNLLSGNAVANAQLNINFSQNGTISGGTIHTKRSSTTNITFENGGTLTSYIKTEENGVANIVFNGDATIGDDTAGGGIYTRGGTTNITFNSGTSTLKGKVHDEGNDGTTGGKAIISRYGGTTNLFLNNATVTVGYVFTRTYDDGYTNFNFSKGKSTLNVDNLLSYSTTKVIFGNDSGGSIAAFTGGISLDYGGTVEFVMGETSDKSTELQEVTVKGDLTIGSNPRGSFKGIQKYTFNGDNFKLNVQDSGGSKRNISLSDTKHKSITTFNGINNTLDANFSITNGINEITFNEGAIGTIDGTISTTGGTTTISVASGAQGTITGTVNGSGTTNVVFLKPTPAPESRNESMGILTLNGSANTISTITANGSNGMVVSGATTQNTINSLALSENGKVAFYNGTSTIKGFGSGNGTLELTTKADEVNTLVKLQLTGNGGSNTVGTKILFTGGTEDQRYRSTLEVIGANNTINSLESQATNAVVELNGSSAATKVDITNKITITEGHSLLFSLTSGTSGNSAIATAQGGITVENGGTLGVAIGAGTDEKKLVVGSNGNVEFKDGSTLQVDFLKGAQGTATLGSNSSDQIEIKENRKSIINFHADVSNGVQLNGGLKINGGDNTINFLGDATLSSVTFTSGTNTINVYDGVEATINLGDSNGPGSQLGSMTNTINLKSGSTLDVQQTSGSSGSGTLTASSADKPSTLNFIGDNATFKGGFSANGQGKALINVGLGTQKPDSVLEVVSGTITGEVTGADLAFNAGKSTLTLQGGTNTFKNLTSNAKDGILVLNSSSKVITASFENGVEVKSGTSLTFSLDNGTGNNKAEVTLKNGLSVKSGGTLGIAIGGTGNGERKVIINGGNNNYENMFEEGSTLRIDFLKDASGSATLGGGTAITIGENRNSEINFYGTTSGQPQADAPSLAGGITLKGGTNTANFYGSATLSGIELKSGKNYINVKADQTGITATVDTSKITGESGLTNYINLENKATIDLQNNNSGSGTGSITASVTVSGSETKVKGSLTDSSITFDKAIADLTLQGTNTITTLTGFATPASYIRQGRVVTPTVENTLILADNSSAEIKDSVTSDTVGLKFASGNNAKTFTFSASGNTISNVAIDTTSGSTNNTLAFTNGASTIAQAIAIGSNNDLTIALGTQASRDSEATSQDVSLLLAEGLSDASGTAKIKVVGNSSVSGGVINISALNYDSAANFTIKNASATFAELDTNSNASTLTLDGSENEVNVVITKLNSNNLTANFAGQGEGQEATLSISGGSGSSKEITLKDISVADGSTHNTLDLSALTTANVTNGIEVKGSAESAKGLTIKLQDTELALTGGMTTSDATTTVRVEGTAGASATISGTKAIQITNLDMVGAGALKTTLAATDTQISTLTAQGETSNTLIVDGSSAEASGAVGSIVGESLQVELNGTTGATLAINGVGGTIKSLSATNGTANTLSLQSGKLVVTDIINKSLVGNDKTLNLEFTGNSELSVVGGIDTQTGSGGNVNISVKGTTTPSTREVTGEGGEEITPQPIPTEGIISGGDIKINTLSFADNAVLQVRNANATFTEVKGTGVLSLDGANTKNGVKATVTNEITNSSNAITANFNGRNDKGNELELKENSTLKTITFGDNSVNNKISVAGTKTLTLSEQVVVTKGSGITFALANGSILDFKQGMVGEGTSTLRVEATSTDNNNSTLKGGTFTSNAREASSENSESVTTGTEITNLDLVAYVDPAGSNNKAAKLTIQASDVTIGKVTAQEGETTLALDASSNAVNTTLNIVKGDNLTVELTSGSDATKATNLTLNKNITLKTIATSGMHNTLNLSDTKTLKIADTMSVDSSNAIAINFNSSTLTLNGSTDGLKVNGGNVDLNFISGRSVVNGNQGIKLESGELNLNFKGNRTEFELGNNFSRTNGKLNINFEGDDSTLFFAPTGGDTKNLLSINVLNRNGNNNTVDIASSLGGNGYDVDYTRKDFRVLKVGDNTADADTTRNTLNFKVFVDKTQSGGLTIGGETLISGQATDYGYAYSDRIILDKGIQTADTQAVTHNLLIIPKIDQLGQITYKSGGTETEGNVAVATVKKDSGITLATEKVISGFEVIQAELVQVETNEKGDATNGGDYTTYFLGEVKSVGASEQMQDVASTALSINYDLYMANFNSLNKRMGELRDDPYNQGVWARVFGGSQESSFGVGSKSEYVTFQAGYDYDFTFSNAKNYLGVAFSYATSTSKSFDAFQNIANANASASNIVGIENIKSGAYEIAVYNSYISDSGWYNDTIAKFSYINSTFNLTGSANDSQTTNMAFTIGDEVGYRYKFAENEKGSWYVDPQVEIAFGYLNQSDFNSKMHSAATSSGYSTLSAYQDAVMTLRTRVGASLGKKFNTQNGFASLYVGAFYEYDYVEGGSSDVGVGSGATNTLTPLSSSGRAVLNIGSNIALTENARLYVDVEKSLGDKFTTHMQFNFGARYSF